MEKTNKITAYNIISTVILQGISLFTAPIISRMLGTSNYGIAALYVTWVTIITTVFGLQTKSSLAVARKEYDISEQNSYQASVLFLSIFSYLLLSCITVIFINPISELIKLDKRIILFALAQGIGQYCVSYFNLKNTYEFNAKTNFFLSLIVSVSTTGLSLALIYLFPKSYNYWGRIFGLSIPYVIIGLIIAIFILKRRDKLYNKQYWIFCLAFSIPMMVHDLSGIILNQSDRVMLQTLCDTSSVGIYSLACGFSMVLSVIWGALNNSWVPFYYEYAKNNDLEIMHLRAKRYFELFTVLSCGFILLAPEVFHLYAGKSFWGGTILIPVFAIGYYMVFLYSFPVNFEIYSKKTKLIAVITLIAAGFNIFLNYLLIPPYGILGAAIATSSAHAIQFLLHYISAVVFIKEDRFHFNFSFFIPGTVFFFLICFITYLTDSIWLIRWSIGAVIGIIELIKITKRKAIF